MLIVLHALSEWHWLESKHIKPYSPWDPPLLQSPITKLVMWSNMFVNKRPKKENKLARMSRFWGFMGTWRLIRLRIFFFPRSKLKYEEFDHVEHTGQCPFGYLFTCVVTKHDSPAHFGFPPCGLFEVSCNACSSKQEEKIWKCVPLPQCAVITVNKIHSVCISFSTKLNGVQVISWQRTNMFYFEAEIIHLFLFILLFLLW